MIRTRGKLPGISDLAFEDHCHLLAITRMQIQGRDVGAYLLETKEMGISHYSFVFGFRFPGIHTLLAKGEADRFLQRLDTGLRKIQPNQKLRVHFRSFASDQIAQEELSALLSQGCSKESTFFIEAERKHLRDLTARDRRQHKEIVLFATYSIGSFGSDARGFLEKGVGLLANVAAKFGGKVDDQKQAFYKKLLAEGYRSGFRPWLSRLGGMGLRPELMSTEALWLDLAKRFRHNPPAEVPHCLTISDETGHLEISEEINSPLEPLSVAIRGENGRAGHPQGGREFAVVKDKLIAVLALEEKPNAWISPEHQLYSTWEVLADIPDCEFICEISAGDRRRAYHLLNRTGKAGIKSLNSSAGKSMNTKAGQNVIEAGAAQSRINAGVSPVFFSAVALLHRDTQEELAKSCEDLSSNFIQGLFVRDKSIALDIWRRSLPVVDAQLLPDGRRMQYLSDEIAGVMPLVCPYAADPKGLEFVTMQGRMPLHVDIYARTLGVLIFGETRSAKSVVFADMAVKAVARGMNVIVIDATREDGASTYTELVKFYGAEGAYFDVGSQANNLFQPPDFSQRTDLDASVIAQRIESYQEFLIKALTVMVMGEETSSLTKRVRTLLVQSITPFFKDDAIRDRYQAALKAGLGSPAWFEMPTLSDFVEFFSELDFKISGESVLIAEAKDTILLELRGWLTSRIGRAINSPSTLDFDKSRFTVFALSNISDDTEAAVLALSAQSLALRKALQLRDCLVAIEEAPILLKYKGLAEIVGEFCSNGQKTGIKPVIISQTVEAITDSAISSQITNNLRARLIGCTTQSSISSFSKLLGYDPEVLAKNAEKSFFVDSQEMRSSWLIDIDSTLVHCHHYPSPELLTIVANNPAEREFRDKILKQHPNKYVGIVRAREAYIAALQAGKFKKGSANKQSNVVELRHAS
jgi:hypothetical protein